MFEGGMGTEFVVNRDGADGAGLQFAANHRRGNIAFFQVAKNVNIHE